MKAIRISMVLFPLIGSQMVITFFFQSIGKVRVSIFLSLSRQLIFLLPALAVFPLFRGVDGVWYAMPFADGFAAFIAAVIMLFNVKKFKKQHKELQYGEQEDDH